jgi:8-oxo-dGTP pyrophosphatase MutT (NUDIX family)
MKPRTRDELDPLDRLRARLSARRRLEIDPATFAGGMLRSFRPAAVLLPVVTDEAGPPSLVFTQRHAGLPTHAGQIAFPGGKRDAEDVDLRATALRETREELGIDEAAVDVLGLLDDIPTPTGFVVTPVVGHVRGPLALTPATNEVAAVFICPLDELARPERYRHNGERTFLGVRYVMHEFIWNEHRIWGATAHMTYQLLGLLRSGSDD